MTSAERREGRYQRRKAARLQHRAMRNQKCGSFEEVFSFEHLYKSYEKCRKGVLWKASVQTYKANCLLNVCRTHQELMDGSFVSRGFVEFDINERGKTRHIRSVHISERVVQRCLCDYCLTPLLSSTFIYDNGASLRGKGIDFTLHRLTEHLHAHYRKYGSEGYILLFDFRKYFDSIDHGVLMEECRRCIADERILSLLSYLIAQFGDQGLGLGSQVSQICALAAANPLDHHIKEVLRIKKYGRYMDDGYIIHPDKDYLHRCLESMTEVCKRLRIELNLKKTQIVKLSRGFTFLQTRFLLTSSGAIVRRINPDTVIRMRRKMRSFARWLNQGKIEAADVASSYNAWKSHIMKCQSYQTLLSTDRYVFDCLTRAAPTTLKG